MIDLFFKYCYRNFVTKGKREKLNFPWFYTVMTEYFNTFTPGRVHAASEMEISGPKHLGRDVPIRLFRRTRQRSRERRQRRGWPTGSKASLSAGNQVILGPTSQKQQRGRHSSVLAAHVYIHSAVIADTIMENQIPYQARLSGWRSSRRD